MPDSPEKVESKKVAQHEELGSSADERDGFGNFLDIVDRAQTANNSNSDRITPGDEALTDDNTNLPKIEINSDRAKIGGALESESDETTESTDKGSELTGEAREKYYTDRFKDVTGQDSVIKEGPEKELNNWADSWKDFIEEVEVPEGAYRDLLQDLGAQMILGEFDESSLAHQMSQIENSENLQSTIDDLNKYSFRGYGVRIDLDFDKKGKLDSIELKSIAGDGKTEAVLKVSADGKVEAKGKNDDGKPLSQDDAVKKVARKASPLACP